MSYLEDTRYATEALFRIINEGTCQLAEKQVQLNNLQEKFRVLYQRFQSMDLTEDFSDPQLMHAGTQAHAAYEDVASLQENIAELQREIADREFARRALSGAILQIAKQGIDSMWGKYDNAPKVLWNGKTHLAQTVWEARNQSMHYEQPLCGKIRDVFEALAAVGCLDFELDEQPYKNRALEILAALGWQTNADYERDMTVLLAKHPCPDL
jgi:uncharacterized small protein (DUF1192 family)